MKKKTLAPRHFLTLQEYSPAQTLELIQLAAQVKAHPKRWAKALTGQSLAMIFEKSSTRTRVSFEVAMTQLGGHALHLSGSDMQLGRGETVPDTARVLSRFVQAVMIRTFEHSKVEDLAASASIPIINGLSDSHHPCQALADYLTMRERFGKLKGLTLVYVGDGNNVAHSLLIGGALLGVHVRIVCPLSYKPDSMIVDWARKTGRETGSLIDVYHRVKGSARGAQAVYTDVWTSMGQEAEQKKRLKAFKGFQVNEALMEESPKAIFLHCLPAHRGEEVSAGVMDSPRAAVWDQAENRLHAQKAVLLTLLGKA
jgi:ornithine carbamoyltransferase